MKLPFEVDLQDKVIVITELEEFYVVNLLLL